MPRKKAATKKATKATKSKKNDDQSPASEEPMMNADSGTAPPPGPAVEDLLSKLPENRFELEVSAE